MPQRLQWVLLNRTDASIFQLALLHVLCFLPFFLPISLVCSLPFFPSACLFALSLHHSYCLLSCSLFSAVQKGWLEISIQPILEISTFSKKPNKWLLKGKAWLKFQIKELCWQVCSWQEAPEWPSGLFQRRLIPM